MKGLVSGMIVAGLFAATATSASAHAAAPAGGKPVHVLKDTSALDARFRETLKSGVEYHAVIELAKGGEIEIALYPEIAPNHVANFVSLARKGFYNGVTFHRVIPGFMAQGGDPTGTGGGGPGYSINAEFSSTPHVRGTLSMARTNDPNSAGSQFFICFKPTPFLDGKYSVFGQVIRGMEHVDSLKPRDPNTNPNFPGDAMKTVRIVEVGAAKPAARTGSGGSRRRGSKAKPSGMAEMTPSPSSSSGMASPAAAATGLVRSSGLSAAGRVFFDRLREVHGARADVRGREADASRGAERPFDSVDGGSRKRLQRESRVLPESALRLREVIPDR